MRALVLLGLVLAAGAALGHPGDEFETLTAETGNVTFYVTPQTLVVKAQRDVVLIGEASTLRDDRYVPLANATWIIDARGPGEATIAHQPYGYGFGARANFSAPGAWTLLVSANGTSAELPVDVYPPTSVRAESTSLRYNAFYAGRGTQSSVHFIDDATGNLVRKDATVHARIERWENGTKTAELTVPLAKGRSAGEFSLEHTFDEPGSYRIRIMSPEHAIAFEDLPPFKVNVLEARFADPDEPPRDAPGAALPLVVLASTAALAARPR